MIDPEIENKVTAIRASVDLINCLIADLYEHNVEIRISYQDASNGNPPSINLWRATEHIDYLKNVPAGDIPTT